jgi:hypothetical protein
MRQAAYFLEVPQFSPVLPPLPDNPRGFSKRRRAEFSEGHCDAVIVQKRF